MRASFKLLYLFAIIASIFVFSCGPGQPSSRMTILSGSENQVLEPLLREYTKKTGVEIAMTYKGSVDIKLMLSGEDLPYDAVWPANSLWISLGDQKKRVSHLTSIYTSPVVFGIAKSKAQALGFIGKDIQTKDILAAIEAKKLQFFMTSATQSNSGATAYLGFLSALAGNPDVLTDKDLDSQSVQDQLKKLLSGVNRSSASSAWLADLYLSSTNANAMVNYESVIIETNQKLEQAGREPLYLIYPVDGMVVSDSPLGFVKSADSEAKESTFLDFQKWLLSPEIQNRILAFGKRTGIGGGLEGADPKVFRAEWGIDPSRILSGIKLPSAALIEKSLVLYQTVLRKPSLTVFCLDYSGSMKGEGEAQLKEAMHLLLNQTESAKYLLTSSPNDRFLILPFSDQILDRKELARATTEGLNDLDSWIQNFEVGGKTDIYSPVIEGLKYIAELKDRDQYQVAIVLMTDGVHNRPDVDYSDLDSAIKAVNLDIPVFPIMFAEADEDQLTQIATATKGRLFDGRKDLVSAFRSVRGYN